MASRWGIIFQISLSDGGVPKRAVREAEVTQSGLAGDRQRNTTVHGGPQRAVCLFSLERIQALQAEGHPVFPGAAGENLTLSGLDWTNITPGTRLRIGEGVILEVTQYITPCENLKDFFLDGYFNRIHQVKHPGWSRLCAKVLEGGLIRTADRVSIE